MEDSRRDQSALVIFVGDARPRVFQGRHTLIVDKFAGVQSAGIVVGVWRSGDFLRTDLPDDATDNDVWKAILAPPPPGYPDESPIAKPVKSAKELAIEKWMTQPLNVGSCPCGRTGGCHCLPHDLCRGGQCQNHNPLLYK